MVRKDLPYSKAKNAMTASSSLSLIINVYYPIITIPFFSAVSRLNSISSHRVITFLHRSWSHSLSIDSAKSDVQITVSRDVYM
jgi:hypothetical protein